MGYRVGVLSNVSRDPGGWAAISLQGASLKKRVHPRLFHPPGTRLSHLSLEPHP